MRDRDVLVARPPTDDLEDVGLDGLGGDAALDQHLGRQGIRDGEQPEQQVLGADVGVAELPGGDPGAGHADPGPVGEALAGERLRGEPLLGGLLADAEGLADLAPRGAAPPGLVDEVAEQRVGELADLVLEAGRLLELGEGLVRRRRADGGDQGVEGDGHIGHASICT